MNRLDMFRLMAFPFRSLFGSGLGNIRLVKKLFRSCVVMLFKSQYVVVDIGGCKLGLTISDERRLESLGASLIFGNGYEIQMTKLFKSLVKEGMNVVDVGAHIGYYTIIASSFVGQKGNVWAFEPEPGNIKELRNNMTLNDAKNVTLLEQAVSDKCGKAQFFVSDELSGECSLVKIKNRLNKTIDVDIVALDDVLGGEKVDVLKIDVDGGEIGVLRGAKRLIRNNPNIKVFTEFWIEGLKEAGYSCEDYWRVLTDYGFNYIYLIDEKSGIAQRTSLESVIEYLSKSVGMNLLCCKNEDGISFRNRIPKIVTEKMHKRIHKRLDVLCEILRVKDRVLEVGCGTGANVVTALKHLAVYVVAIDNDEASLEYAIANNKADNVEYVLSAGEDYYNADKFDVIVCSHIVEHLEKPMMMLDNLKRLLKDDGVLYVGVPNGYGCFEVENYLPRLIYRTRWGMKLINRMMMIKRVESDKDTLNTESQHIKFFTIKGITRLLEKSGWVIDEVIKEELFGGVITDRTILRFPKVADWNINIADRLPASMANGWILICRKSL